MTWFANDGGPLIVLDASVAPAWHGVGEDPHEDIPPSSDYARACAAGHPAGLLPVGQGLGVVLGAQEAVSVARWFQGASPTTLFLVGCVFGEDTTDLTLFELLLRNRGIAWHDLGVLTAPSGTLLLLHAADLGAEVAVNPARDPAVIGDALSYPATPGRYQLSAAELRIGEEALYLVLRWDLRMSRDAAV